MNFQCTLLTTRDLTRAKQFYCNLLGMTVSADYGANVVLSDSIALQTMDTWQDFIHKDASAIKLQNNAMELYFEETDLDSFLEKLRNFPETPLVHPLKEHRWGQRVIRFYDPDGHIIEVGETMSMVAKRFFTQGMSAEQVSSRMGIPLEQITLWLKRIALSGCEMQK